MLRGLAALLVVCAHILPQLDHFGGPHLGWLSLGGSGVDIFFVISGFIIWVTSQDRALGPARFLERRAIRVIPLYWLATAFVASVALLMPSVMSSTRFDPVHVLCSFLFIPYPHPVLDAVYPIIVPGWSLNYEAFFYLLFGASLMFRDRLASLAVTLAVLAGLVLYGHVAEPSQVQLAYFTQPIMLEFAFGLMIGALYTHVRVPPLWLGAAALALGVAALIAFSCLTAIDDHRVLLAGGPAALMVWGMTVLHRHHVDPAHGVLIALGDASYSIYLSHVIVLPIGARLWTMAGLGFQDGRLAAFIAFELALAACAGWLLYQLVENPMLSYLRKRLGASRRAAQPARVGA